MVAVRKKNTTEEPEEGETRVVRGLGDNSGATAVSGSKLKGIISKIEKVNARKDQVLQELREEYAEAKALGYDTKTIRTIVRERKVEPEKRKEQAELLRVYKDAMGILDDEE